MASKKSKTPAKAPDPQSKNTTQGEPIATQCILTTSLGTVSESYQPGDLYTASGNEVARLIARNMANPI